jgi:hypothetical protein
MSTAAASDRPAPFPGDPYDVSGAYVLQAGQVGSILRISGTAFAAVTR